MRTRTYWRVHHSDCPEFSAENATNAPWGWVEHAEDCPFCDDDGHLWSEAHGDYIPCPFHGVENRALGYSCCESPTDLVNYFEARGGAPDDAAVVVFKGRMVGHGPDGEPLVIPHDDRPRPRWLRYGQVKSALEGRHGRDIQNAIQAALPNWQLRWEDGDPDDLVGAAKFAVCQIDHRVSESKQDSPLPQPALDDLNAATPSNVLATLT